MLTFTPNSVFSAF